MIAPEELQELIEQLPFYVNGTVSAELKARIEAALPGSEALRVALHDEQQIQSRVVSAAGELLAQSEPHSERREAAVASAQPPSSRAEAADISTGFASALGFLNPQRWNPALALSIALVVAGQGAVIATQSVAIASLEKENFELASGPCGDRDRSGGIVLELKDDAPWKAVAELLDTETLIIVESGAFGVLTLRGEQKGTDRDALVQRLKQSPLVAGAEPEA